MKGDWTEGSEQEQERERKVAGLGSGRLWPDAYLTDSSVEACLGGWPVGCIETKMTARRTSKIDPESERESED